MEVREWVIDTRNNNESQKVVAVQTRQPWECTLCTRNTRKYKMYLLLWFEEKCVRRRVCLKPLSLAGVAVWGCGNFTGGVLLEEARHRRAGFATLCPNSECFLHVVGKVWSLSFLFPSRCLPSTVMPSVVCYCAPIQTTPFVGHSAATPCKRIIPAVLGECLHPLWRGDREPLT